MPLHTVKHKIKQDLYYFHHHAGERDRGRERLGPVCPQFFFFFDTQREEEEKMNTSNTKGSKKKNNTTHIIKRHLSLSLSHLQFQFFFTHGPTANDDHLKNRKKKSNNKKTQKGKREEQKKKLCFFFD